MADDLDALLARADYMLSVRHLTYQGDGIPKQRTDLDDDQRLVRDLAAALRESHADYLAALDVIARLSEGWDVASDGSAWFRDPIEIGHLPMSDREWRVYCHAAQRATRSQT